MSLLDYKPAHVIEFKIKLEQRLALWHQIIPKVIKAGKAPSEIELTEAFYHKLKSGMLKYTKPEEFFDNWCRYNKLPVLSDFLSDNSRYQP